MEIKDFKTILHGKTALVTGAGKGIGAAIAKGLGACGVTVFCLARTSSDIKNVVAEIVGAGGEAQALSGDVTSPDDMLRTVDIISEASNTLEIAFLNAGANLYRGSIADSDIASWQAAVELNLHSVFYGIRAVVPIMKKGGGGKIIFTGSAMAHYTSEDNSSYCAAKAGARMVAKTAAMELGPFGISVNELIPGPTITEQALKGTSMDDPNSPFNNTNEWVKQPEDVVPMALMMAAFADKGPNAQIFSLARR